MPDDRYVRAVLALEEIIADPNETPERKARAQAALDNDRNAGRGYGSSSGIALSDRGGIPGRHTYGGGYHLHTEATEQGWGDD